MKLVDLAKKKTPFKALFVGGPGGGKSLALASLPRPLYIFDLDGRIKSIISYYRDDLEGIEADYFGPFDYNKFCDKYEEVTDESKSRYASVGVDSLTAFARMSLEYSLSLRGADKGKKKGRVNIVDIDDYNAEDQMVSDLFNIARALSRINIVITAHLLDNFQGQRTLLSGAKRIRTEALAYFDEVWQFYPDTTFSGAPAYMCTTRPMKQDPGKTAMDLPPIWNWTGSRKFYDGVQELLQGKTPEHFIIPAEKKVKQL